MVPEGTHRLFVAIPVAPAALDACRRLLEPVRTGPAGRAARWVRTDNLHLTLRFLGATPAEQVEHVAAAMREAATGRRMFEMRLAGAGAFPSASRPRVLWLGLARGAAEAAAITETLQEPLAALGWPRDERPFKPHLTVARTDAASIADGARVAAALVEAAAPWQVDFVADRVVLYRSHLRSGPPVYEVVDEVALLA